MQYHSTSVARTGEIASRLVRKIAAAPSGRNAVVIALTGELGAGKTTFVKAFARALGIKQKLTSPTFVLMREYRIPLIANRRWTIARKRKYLSHSPLAIDHSRLYHIDAYRLNNGRDLVKLGIQEILTNPANLVLIEWAERVKDILPREHTTIRFEHVSEKERKLVVSGI